MLYVAFVGLCRWAPSLATGSSPSLLWTSWTAFMKGVRGATPRVTQLLSQDVFNTDSHMTNIYKTFRHACEQVLCHTTVSPPVGGPFSFLFF